MADIKPVRKAVFPVAGLGTRFLPATKSVPKEMLTIVDKPVIQYAVEEARAAGIEHFVFVTGRNKAVIEDHFDIQVELEHTLRQRGKQDALDLLASSLPLAGQTSFTRQQSPLGLGHAVWCARDIIGDEPFALLLPDMVMQDRKGCLSSMVELYNETGGNIIATEEVAWEETHKYGVVETGNNVEGGFEITNMVEKPEPGSAPSNLFINGRYILQPEIFDILSGHEKGAGGEIQITDAMIKLAKSQKFYGFRFAGRTFDCGSREGFITANVAIAMTQEDLNGNLRVELKRILAEVLPEQDYQIAG
ncbi:MAG: UTP--glucose-1-phosphate uridylyltransferase GalU [Hyphomicrobiales bacterium]|nr:UTP--glucose-1-phosphate uridylyltransferase GalU [Hyphomicrobiales bacterium]